MDKEHTDSRVRRVRAPAENRTVGRAVQAMALGPARRRVRLLRNAPLRPQIAIADREAHCCARQARD
jgi:hypothetical protein